jgi:hypothetical protein
VLIESESIKPPKSLEELSEYCEVVLSASRYVAAVTGKVRNLAILVGNKVSISLPFNHENEEAVQKLKTAARSLGCIIYIFDAYVSGDYSLMVLGYTPSFKVHLRNFLKAGPDGKVVDIAPTYEIGEATGAEFLDPWRNERVTGVVQ